MYMYIYTHTHIIDMFTYIYIFLPRVVSNGIHCCDTQILPTLGVQENLKGMEEIIPVIEKIQHEFQDPVSSE